MTFSENLKLHLRAGVPALYVESHEWMRFRDVIQRCCCDPEVAKEPFIWNPLEGFDPEPKGGPESPNVDRLLDFLNKTDLEESVFVLEFFDRWFGHPEHPALPEVFAVAMRRLRDRRNHVVILSPTRKIPTAVQKEFAVLDFPLPSRDEIRVSLKSVAKEAGLADAKVDTAPPILDSVRGLGATEILNAFSKAAVDRKQITAEEIPLLVSEKEQIIRKSGYLDFVRTDDVEMRGIGGLGELKEWLRRRKDAFGKRARDALLTAPKGVLLLGVPGTGKSLCAKAVAREWKMPLLRLDMGRVFGGIIGESEANMRNAVKVAEGLEPCVLWIDEIEKGISGGASASGELDGGTAARVFGSFLTWMQEKDKEVFVFATANDLSRLPPELLRKGRFDEIFFVDLPGKDARNDIFRIHLGRKGQESVEPSDELLAKTEGFSGSEIEAVVNEALFLAYELKKPPRIQAAQLIQAAGEIVPLSSTMGDVVAKIRKWAEKRCRGANDKDDTPPDISDNRAAPRLRAEISNPFAEEGK